MEVKYPVLGQEYNKSIYSKGAYFINTDLYNPPLLEKRLFIFLYRKIGNRLLSL